MPLTSLRRPSEPFLHPLLLVEEPIDAPLFRHLSDAKRQDINKYRADYRKYRLGYASGARGEVADVFKRQLSTEETCEPVRSILERTVSGEAENEMAPWRGGL